MQRDGPAVFDDDRVGREREELTGWDRVLTDTIYYGLGGVLLLTFPAQWLVFQTPTIDLEATAAVWGALVATILGIGFARGGHLEAIGEWPSLSGRALGSVGGYCSILTRGVYLCSTFLIAAYGGAVVAIAVASVIGGVNASGLAAIVGVCVGAIAVAALPTVLENTHRLAPVRIGYHAFAIITTLQYARPFDFSTGDPAAALFAIGLVAAATVDAVWLLRRSR
ncbi:hypothetical protein [Halalkalirubrum salinum]|uniref:hypothetical protein n=1 Tax=Halalkalirubrum salinum TaxID=2563889 RepID=UPI0010FB387F|nr:hypothetical protein [Halalkalirubrum salinum]